MTHICIVHPSLRLTFADFRQTSCGTPRWSAAWLARIRFHMATRGCFFKVIESIRFGCGTFSRNCPNDSSWLNVTSPFSVSYMKEGRCSNTKLQIQVVVAALKAIVCRTRCVFSYGGSYANGRIAVAQHWHVVWCLFCSWLASDGSYESINESAEMKNRSSHFQIRSPNRFHWFANCQNE